MTYAEKLQYEGYLRRQETNEAVRELSKKGTSIRQIVRQTGHSRKLVRDVLRGQRLDVFRTRPSSLDSWLPWLNSRWEEGAQNALALWREMKAKGFPGQSGVISQWAQRRRLAEKANQSGLARTPSARVGKISKQGNKQLRTLLIVGATSILKQVRRGVKLPAWVVSLIARRPYKVAAVALANKMARTIWALLVKGGVYQPATPSVIV